MTSSIVFSGFFILFFCFFLQDFLFFSFVFSSGFFSFVSVRESRSPASKVDNFEFSPIFAHHQPAGSAGRFPVSFIWFFRVFLKSLNFYNSDF